MNYEKLKLKTIKIPERNSHKNVVEFINKVCKNTYEMDNLKNDMENFDLKELPQIHKHLHKKIVNNKAINLSLRQFSNSKIAVSGLLAINTLTTAVLIGCGMFMQNKALIRIGLLSATPLYSLPIILDSKTNKRSNQTSEKKLSPVINKAISTNENKTDKLSKIQNLVNEQMLEN